MFNTANSTPAALKAASIHAAIYGVALGNAINAATAPFEPETVIDLASYSGSAYGAYATTHASYHPNHEAAVAAFLADYEEVA